MLLGLGELYINDVYVGNVKDTVELKYNSSFAFARPGNSIADVKGERTAEEVTLTAKLCDFKLSQLRVAMGLNQAVASGSFKLRKKDVIKLSGTGDHSLTETMVTGSLKVSKLDRSVVYTSGTHYSATVSSLARKSVGSLGIADQQHVIAEYDFMKATANALRFGGEKLAPNTFELAFVHKQSNGELIQVTLYKAMVSGDTSLPFHEKSSGNYTVNSITFKALVDLTKPEGENLGEIVEEGPLAAS